MREGALSVDAPVTLDELLDRNARETLAEGARELGVEIGIVDRDGLRLLGVAGPPEVEALDPDLDPLLLVTAGRVFVVSALHHEGASIGRVKVARAGTDETTARRIAQHLLRVADAFVL
ncbi:MAG TPA: hypothetical protein VII38_15785, partial [Polyangia bacterium]